MSLTSSLRVLDELDEIRRVLLLLLLPPVSAALAAALQHDATPLHGGAAAPPLHGSGSGKGGGKVMLWYEKVTQTYFASVRRDKSISKVTQRQIDIQRDAGF